VARGRFGLMLPRHRLTAARQHESGCIEEEFLPKSRIAILRATPGPVMGDHHRLMNLAASREVIRQGRRHGAEGRHLYEGGEEGIPVREAPGIAARRRRRLAASTNEGGPR